MLTTVSLKFMEDLDILIIKSPSSAITGFAALLKAACIFERRI